MIYRYSVQFCHEGTWGSARPCASFYDVIQIVNEVAETLGTTVANTDINPFTYTYMADGTMVDVQPISQETYERMTGKWPASVEPF